MNYKPLKKIIIITHESFPFGMGATNRIISWASLLASSGFSVKIYIVKPTDKLTDIKNIAVEGTYKGIKYKYLNGTTIWPIQSNRFHKFIILITGYIRIIKQLISEKPDIVITYEHDLYTQAIIIILRPFIKYKIIAEETEYPKVLRKKPNSLYRKLFLSFYPLYDGMIVMTKELKGYYCNIGARNIFHLPMTVDNSRFKNVVNKGMSNKQFVYVGGSGGFVRDGVLDIVKAFHLFSLKLPQFKLLIVGPINKSSEEYIKIVKYITTNSLSEKISLTGSITSDEIPELLANSTGIIMAPPQNYVSGGFPTKLGEFLASGTPVVTTSVSDIPYYLNETNSFMANPGDIHSISSAMYDLVQDMEKSKLIGQKGKELAQTVFNADTYLSSLIMYINLRIRKNAINIPD